jgi:hypothetical protein
VKDMQEHRNVLLQEAVKCQRISDETTDQTKRELFAKLAKHHRMLAAELDSAIDRQATDPT